MIWRALETRGARAGRGLCDDLERRHVQRARRAAPARAGRGAQRHRRLHVGALANVKNVFVVDPDIDVFSDEQMDWALATRFQPDRDLIVIGGMRTLPLDPSLTGGARAAPKAGFDLTWPFGTGERGLKRACRQPPRFDGRASPRSRPRSPTVRNISRS